MKTAITMAVALALAASLAGCATAMPSDQFARDMYREENRGNVSTTQDGRVNGTNPQDRAERQHPATQEGLNTNAMGAGNQAEIR